jgi:AcrR family transcriptional regulator
MARKANSRALNREVVVQTAASLVDSAGLEQITMADLAQHLEIRTPSLYNHVQGMEGLRRELALLGTRELTQRMGQAVIGKAGDEAILALADTYRTFVKERPGLYTATLRAPAIDDLELQRAAQELIDVLLKVLSAYHLQGEIAIHTIRMLRSLIHGFTTLEIAGGFAMPVALDETFRRLIDMFLLSVHTMDIIE